MSVTDSITINQATNKVTVTAQGSVGLNAGGQIDGNLEVTGTLAVGGNQLGKDVRFWGATANKYFLWDASQDTVIITGDLRVDGQTTIINSTVVSIADPVFSLGGTSVPTSADSKDRGIEHFYYDTAAGAGKRGFFGYSNADNAYKFLTDCPDPSGAEIFTGTAATLHMGHLNFVEGSGGQIQFNGTEKINIGTNNIGLRKPIYGMVSTVDIGLSSNPFRAGYFSGTVNAAELEVAQSADDAGLEIKGYDDKSGETLKAYVKSTGDSRIDATRALYLYSGDSYGGGMGSGTTSGVTWDAFNQFTFTPESAARIPLSIEGASGQSGDLFNITSNGGSAGDLLTVDSSGNVGIGGVTAPASVLHIKDATNPPEIRLEDAAGGTQTAKIVFDQAGQNSLVLSTQYSSATNVIQFAPAGSVAMTLQGGGNVGIGTTAPYAYDTTATRLHVKDAGSSGSISEVARLEGASDADGSGAILRIGTSNDRGLYLEGGRVGSVPYASIGTTEYNGAKTEGMRIDSSGNVGIGGVTAPATKLDVADKIRVAENSNVAFYGADFVRLFVNQSYSFTDSGGTVKAKIGLAGDSYFTGGNLGVGTSSPAAKIHAYSSGNGEVKVERASGAAILTQAQASLGRFGTSSNHNLQLMANNTGYVTVTTAGRVGISTSSPISQLHVNNSVSGSNTDGISIGKVESSGWTDANEELGRLSWAGSYSNSSTAGVGAYISAAADANWDGTETPARLTFNTAPESSTTPVERLRIDSSGNVGINNQNPTAAKLVVRKDDGYAFRTENASGYTFRIAGATGNTEVGGALDVGGNISSTSTVEDGSALINTFNANVATPAEQFFVGNNLGDVDLGNKRGDLKLFCGSSEFLRLDDSDDQTVASKDIRFQDSIKARFGSSSNLQIQHNGTDSRIDSTTGNLLLVNYANGKDIGLYSDDGSGGVTSYLTIDGSREEVVASKPLIQTPGTVDPANNGELAFTVVSNTSIKIKYKGTDGTVRSTSLTLS